MPEKKKEDFTPFDIYQFVDPKLRTATITETEYNSEPDRRYDQLLAQAQQQLLVFSGNLGWAESEPGVLATLEQLAQRKVPIKILTQVDITTQKSTEELLNFNHRYGWDCLEIRHCEQPLRAVIIDNQLVSIKEVLSPLYIPQLQQKKYIFYRIQDPEWITWLQKIFWHIWGQSIDATTRLEALRTLRTTKVQKSEYRDDPKFLQYL